MTNDSTGEKIKEKVMETKDKVKETVGETVGMGEKGAQGIKDKVKETIGMGAGEGGGSERKKGQLGAGAATELEEEVAKTSSDSPTKRVEGAGKALGKEEEGSQ